MCRHPCRLFRSSATEVLAAATALSPVDTAICLPSAPVVDRICAISAAVQPVVYAITGTIVTIVGTVAYTIETVVRPIAGSVEPVRSPVVAGLIRAVRATIEVVVDPVATVVEPVVDAVAALVQPVIDAISTLVETVFDAVTALVESILDSVTGIGKCQLSKAESENYQKYSLHEVHFSAPKGIGVVSTYNAVRSERLTSLRMELRILSNGVLYEPRSDEFQAGGRSGWLVGGLPLKSGPAATLETATGGAV